MVSIDHYEKALLIRRTEDTFLDLFSQGKMNGTVHTCNGQEFSAIAFCDAMQAGDFIFSNHRCHGHYLARTGDLEGLMAELLGKENGVCGGIGSSQHLCNENFYSNGIQGGIVPVAAGMAFAAKKKKLDTVGLVFIGDGTLGQGIVYETFNIAALWDLPILIVCEDNGYAQSTAKKNNLSGDIISRAESFGVKTFHSNTWNLEDLFKSAKESIRYVRENSKPAFHLVDTYRLNAHSKSDDDRNRKEVEEYIQKDPLNVFKKNHSEAFNNMLESISIRINSTLEKIHKREEQPFETYYGESKQSVPCQEYLPIEKLNDRVINRINLFFYEIIKKDERVLLIGEDVLSPYGGAFKAAKNLSEKHPNNVISTPISEQAITGITNGLALGGYKPYLEIMFGDFITLAFDQILNHASKFYHMYNKKVNCPIVIRTPMGGGRGYGPTHSQTLDKFLAGIDNVKLVALNSFIDPKIVYDEIYKHEKHPIIVTENKIDYGRVVGDKYQENYILERTLERYPVVRCKPLGEEPTLTIVSYGGIASDVFDVLLNIFIETELLPELFVLTKLNPLDIGPVVNSVVKTKRVIIIEEGGLEYGIGAEILSSILESVQLPHIDLIQRIGAFPVPIPSARSLEENTLPNKTILQQIIQKVKA